MPDISAPGHSRFRATDEMQTKSSAYIAGSSGGPACSIELKYRLLQFEGVNRLMRVDDLDQKELLEPEPKAGVIRFAGRRALLLDAVAMGLLRKPLVETFGLGWAGCPTGT